MEFLGQAAAWFADPAHWAGRDGVPVRLAEHIGLSGVSLLAALLLAVPLGTWIGHTGRGGALVIAVANVGRALPSVAVLGIVFPITLRAGWGLGVPPTLIALTVLAIPPILTNLYVGLREVDPDLLDAAAGLGMSSGQLLRRIRMPIALPVALAGVRTSAVQVVATATLGALLATGGLGRYLIDGIAQRDLPKVFAGGLLVMLLALVTEAAFAWLQRWAVSPGLAAPSATQVSFTGPSSAP